MSEIDLGECVLEADGLMTIPEKVIKALKLSPGDKLAWEILDGVIHISKISRRTPRAVKPMAPRPRGKG